MTLSYVQKTLKNPQKNLLELMNKFRNISGYEINMQNSVAFLYKNSKQFKREIKKIITFPIVSKRIKYLINLSKEAKDLYT